MFAVVSQLEVAMGHHPHLAHPHLRPCHHHSSLVPFLRASKGDSIIIITIITYALVIITALVPFLRASKGNFQEVNMVFRYKRETNKLSLDAQISKSFSNRI